MLFSLKFLVGSCQHVFLQYYYKTVVLSKRRYFRLNLRKIGLRYHETFNGHLDFSSGCFQVIDRSNHEKMLKSRKKPGHQYKNMLSKADNSLRIGKLG